jgi:hypothetical protein
LATRAPSIAAMSTAEAMMIPYQCSWNGPTWTAIGSITSASPWVRDVEA